LGVAKKGCLESEMQSTVLKEGVTDIKQPPPRKKKIQKEGGETGRKT